jgi:hypothetical protein
MEPDDLLYSCNARPGKALVAHAQRRSYQPPSLKSEQASLEGSSVTSLTAAVRPTRVPFLGSESMRARQEHLRVAEKTPGTFTPGF